jgi:hypothetical protein
MLAGLVQTLADVEGRSPLLVARDLHQAINDVLEFRVVGDLLAQGEMPLRAAPDLAAGAFEAVQAAARSEVARRAHYASGTIPAIVRSFVDGARLATDKGSVILRVRAPATEEPAQATLEGLAVTESFERRAVSRLVNGVRAAKSAAHRDLATVDFDNLEDDVEAGLSANLCDALVKLSGERAGVTADVGIRVRWALTRPAAEPETGVKVERGELNRLDEVAALLKQIAPEPHAAVLGPVTRLSHDPGAPTGVVSIQAEIEGKVRLVRMELDAADYELAQSAHNRDDLELLAEGTLEHAGKSREMSNLTRVEIVRKPLPSDPS